MTTTTLGAEAQSILNARIRAGEIVVEYMAEPNTINPPKCLNCNDLQIIWVKVLVGPITKTSSPKTVVTYYNDSLYRVADSYTFPCPVCTDHATRMEFLWQRSGLESNEFDWRIDYIKDMPGKSTAYQTATELLAMTPHPAGLYLFFGDYGVGKTGILKSLVAQFTMAGVPARYIRSADLLSEIRETYTEEAEIDEKDIVQSYGGYSFLAIDEVDVINQTQWGMTMLRTILDTRYTRRYFVATAVATNQTPEQLWGYLASRWESGTRVVIQGKSLRERERAVYRGGE